MLNSGERSVAAPSVFESGSFTMLNRWWQRVRYAKAAAAAKPSVLEQVSFTVFVNSERTVAAQSVFDPGSFSVLNSRCRRSDVER